MYILAALILSGVGALVSGLETDSPPCRFATAQSQNSILNQPDRFAWDLLYWEGQFHQNNVSYSTENGMSFDGTLLDPHSGIATVKHPFSAASKEALQVMVYTHAIAGDKRAARFLSPLVPELAPQIALDVLSKKLASCQEFNSTFPGFGGFLPWFTHGDVPLQPTWDWVNRVPALDNGEFIWAIYSAIEALNARGDHQSRTLASGWQTYLNYVKTTVKQIFYAGNGRVCAVVTIGNQSLPVNHPSQKYTCEGSGSLDDPYEGELFTWFLYFFGGLGSSDRNQLWEVKRPQLAAVNYQSEVYENITVQKGFWFSSHENWKFMEMPYLDIPLVRRVYMNNERARTCNSKLTRNPGMFASVNNEFSHPHVTDASGEITGYISNTGIPSISRLPDQELDVITPYSVFPVMLVDPAIGLVWWKNMVEGKMMQNPYGSTESTRIDGTAVSSFVSWDSKITTVNALLGGVQSFVARKMKRDGVYDEFISITRMEYSRVFTNLSGEDVALCLPDNRVPDGGLVDYTSCS
ncbi:hypothetical protein PLEOSDRAFT_1078667 [Pleurotus ostreatus PC15]|uniref:Endo-beta-1,2-glucanase SGL domain-containing protein n=1 Tax=Pleurotus ostreatus (strain PC15) TaxID=1137138 RepID=A0A067NCA7_PLEO1|nr:hypothetical protein PLEOSDRAFT_1078667 [Pleurotus ostreatus PC15]